MEVNAVTAIYAIDNARDSKGGLTLNRVQVDHLISFIETLRIQNEGLTKLVRTLTQTKEEV